MKKLLILWISIFFINFSSAQTYIEPLKKLNTFLETFEEGYYGPFEVSEGGTLKIHNDHKFEYYDIEMKFITATVAESKSVLIKGSDAHKWEYIRSVRNHYVNAYKFVSKEKNSLNTLLTLINDFIRTYSQDFNLPNITLNLSKPNESTSTGKFTGSLKDGKKSGFGMYSLANGDIIEGKFENDFLNGTGKITYQNGDVYKGEIKDNLPSGQGETIFKEKKYIKNATHKGAYLDGKPNGKGKYSKDSYGEKIIYKGDFKDGRYSGHGVWESVNVSGTVGYRVKRTKNYEGNWELGYYHGTGTLTTKNSLNSSPAKIIGEWYMGNVSNVKAYNENDDLLFSGGKTQQSAYYNKMGIERDERNALELEEQEKNPTVCVCPKCKGTGEIWAKQLETVEIDNGTDKYGNKKTIKENVYTNQFFSLCTKCLGDGKCH